MCFRNTRSRRRLRSSPGTRPWSCSTRTSARRRRTSRASSRRPSSSAASYDVRACAARDGLAALQCYDDADEPASPVVYGAVFRSAGGSRSSTGSSTRSTSGARSCRRASTTGSRTKATGRRSPSCSTRRVVRSRSVRAATAAARGGRGRRWRGEEHGRSSTRRSARTRSTSRPGRYAAGEALLADSRRCAVFDAYKVADRRITPRRARPLSPRVVPVTADVARRGCASRGRFGESAVPALPPGDVRAQAPARSGPAFHDLWRKPFAVSRAWPRAASAPDRRSARPCPRDVSQGQTLGHVLRETF